VRINPRKQPEREYDTANFAGEKTLMLRSNLKNPARLSDNLPVLLSPALHLRSNTL